MISALFDLISFDSGNIFDQNMCDIYKVVLMNNLQTNDPGNYEGSWSISDSDHERVPFGGNQGCEKYLFLPDWSPWLHLSFFFSFSLSLGI